MNKMPFFKFDVSQWLTGKIQLLTATEKGIFIDLVARIFQEKGFLKNDEILHRLIRVEKATLLEALKAFFDLGIMEEKDGFLSVKFIDEQIRTHNEYADKQRAIGAKGGRPKKGTKPKKKEERRKEKEDIREYNPLYICPPVGDDGYVCDPSSKNTTSGKEYPWAEETSVPLSQPKNGYSETFLEIRNRVNTLFRRPENIVWSEKELAALRKVISMRENILAEMDAIENLYNSGYQYARRSVLAFLANWGEEYDRALNDKPRKTAGI